MSTFSGNIGREEEDGAGWGGLVPTKAEREKDKRHAQVAKDQENLHGFVREIMENWARGDINDIEMQLERLALKYGLIKLKAPPPDKPCHEECICFGAYNFEDFANGEVECYEKTELLRGL